MQTHKLVRDFIVQTMRDDQYGFNTALAAALPFYGVTDKIALDWNADSTSVMYGILAGGDFAASKLKGRLTLAIAPGGSQYTGETRGIKWSGIVGLQLVFRILYSYRNGDETPPEDEQVLAIATAIEDALIDVFQRPALLWPDQLIYAKPPDCPGGYQFEPQPDGCAVTIPMSIGLKVDATY